jgi:hypothetical protein
MNAFDRFPRLAVAMFAAAFVAAACTQAVPSASPTTPPPSATTSPIATATAVPTVTATATPTVAPTATPTPEPTPCPVVAQDGTLPSDRLIGVDVASGAGSDRMIFHFGNSALGPGGIPTGELTLAEPPYTFGPSGLPIEMQGERVIQVVFRQMTLSSDLGEPVFPGPDELTPAFSAFRHAVEYDESEGVIGWYLGFDGPACVSLTRNGKDVTVAFEHL